MKKFSTLAMMIALFSVAVMTTISSHAMAEPVTAPMSAKVYKDPNCGCCTVYADLLAKREYDVEVIETDQVVEMTRMMGIPADIQGCHLTMIDGYAISGHVPFETIERLLDEQPDIKALTLPGMPMGSPGMGGVKREPFKTYQISGGVAEVYDIR